MYNLYEYKVPEEIYNAHSNELVGDLSNPDIEGIYETQVPLEFRALLDLGCLCIVDKAKARQLAASAADTGNYLDIMKIAHFQKDNKYHDYFCFRYL